MPEENKEQGESMEGILKSIKNIISGEFDKGASAASTIASASSEEEILELTNKVSNGKAPEPKVEEVNKEAPTIVPPARDVLANIDHALGTNEEIIQAPKEAKVEVVQQTIDNTKPEIEASFTKNVRSEDSIISEESAKNAKESLQSLINKKMPKQQNVDSPSFRSGQTVEDLVIETLKPMLAEWLDANLPTIVKQIVEKEIKKIIPNE